MSPAQAARARQLRGYADHLAAVAEFRRHREADEHARIGALIAEIADALAGPLLEWPGGRCPECSRALGTRCRTCPDCRPAPARSAA